MASAPPRGQLRSLLRSIRRHPWLSTKFAVTAKPSDMYKSPADARELFFGDKASDTLVETVAARLQSDSMRAIMFDMVAGNLVNTKEVRTPILVIGGEEDKIYPPDDVRRTAEAHDTEAVFFPDMGHEMMLEPDWSVVAGCIESWLGLRGI
jgi:pimeloyl-ACP methyl ester carboxylesterase